MKVLDLACEQGHLFEGWFGSDADFQSQQSRALIDCPLCGSQKIEKRLSAPRLNLGKSVAADTLPADPAASAPSLTAATAGQQAEALRLLRQVLAQTEDVGEQFAQQALQMHQGELEPRPIRGQTTAEQAAELIGSGVPIVQLPNLPLLKHTLQ
ncbi:MAG: DUF1178 family protein [Serpentinimonas sp.]|nr:DUF1178 family protein [Serpentinimonas sp.]